MTRRQAERKRRDDERAADRIETCRGTSAYAALYELLDRYRHMDNICDQPTVFEIHNFWIASSDREFRCSDIHHTFLCDQSNTGMSYADGSEISAIFNPGDWVEFWLSGDWIECHNRRWYDIGAARRGELCPDIILMQERVGKAHVAKNAAASWNPADEMLFETHRADTVMRGPGQLYEVADMREMSIPDPL